MSVSILKKSVIHTYLKIRNPYLRIRNLLLRIRICHCASVICHYESLHIFCRVSCSVPAPLSQGRSTEMYYSHVFQYMYRVQPPAEFLWKRCRILNNGLWILYNRLRTLAKTKFKIFIIEQLSYFNISNLFLVIT